jgi:hypothetical protein
VEAFPVALRATPLILTGIVRLRCLAGRGVSPRVLAAGRRVQRAEATILRIAHSRPKPGDYPNLRLK